MLREQQTFFFGRKEYVIINWTVPDHDNRYLFSKFDFSYDLKGQSYNQRSQALTDIPD